MINMKISEFLSKYFLTDGSDLSIKERILFMALICVPYILFSFVLYWDTKNMFYLKIMMGILFVVSPVVFSFIFVDKLNERYGRFSEIRFGYTYQRSLHSVSYFYLTIMGIILLITSEIDKFLLGCLLSFAFVIPFISAYFRTDVFNDSSCYVGGEVVFGYHPFYHTCAVLIGLFGFYNVYSLLNVSFSGEVLLFVVTVLFQIIFLIPNWINLFLLKLEQKKVSYSTY